mmetsp:Transcript_19621/g.59347  ORF Transcript_19621/g.59347 Transcript_19621/m.59347 type:complete len:266 (-) Transcript_19621:618-1415(-)
MGNVSHSRNRRSFPPSHAATAERPDAAPLSPKARARLPNMPATTRTGITMPTLPRGMRYCTVGADRSRAGTVRSGNQPRPPCSMPAHFSSAIRRAAHMVVTNTGSCTRGATIIQAGCGALRSRRNRQKCWSIVCRICCTSPAVPSAALGAAACLPRARACWMSGMHIAEARICCRVKGSIASRTPAATVAKVAHQGSPVTECSPSMRCIAPTTGPKPSAASAGDAATTSIAAADRRVPLLPSPVYARSHDLSGMTSHAVLVSTSK